MGKIVSLILALTLLTACSTSRTIDYSYEETAEALKDRFVKNYDEFEQTKPEVVERPGNLRISFESPVDFYYAASATIGLRELNKGKSELSARIVEYNRTFFGYTGRSESLENKLLDIILHRLKTGEWKRMPWRPAKEATR